MKKILIMILIAVFGMGLVACNPKEGDVIYVYIPDGAPAFSAVKLMHDDELIGGKEFKYIVVSPSTISEYLASGKADYAIVPTNTAANIYNKNTDKPNYLYKMAAAVTHGNLHIVGVPDLESQDAEGKMNELVGKTIGIIGEFGTPNMIFKYITEQLSIEFSVYEDTIYEDKINVKYYSDGSLALAALKTNQADFALLGEPAVTAALNNIPQLSQTTIDICDVWEVVSEGDRLYPQAVLVAKNNMDAQLTEALVQAMKNGEEWGEENPAEALEAIKSHMREGTATTIGMVNSDTIRRCNIKIISSQEAKESVNFYLEAIFSIDQNSVGGKLPNEEFYL